MFVRIKEYPESNRMVQFLKFIGLRKLSYKLEDYFEKKRVSVRIDDFDSWRTDETLSYIIVPVLEQFRKNCWGSPFVDFEDGPEHLRPENIQEAKKNFEENWETDEYWHDRWKWALDEMIYAFKAFRDERMVAGDFEEEQEDRVKNGLRLFAKYYGSLWS